MLQATKSVQLRAGVPPLARQPPRGRGRRVGAHIKHIPTQCEARSDDENNLSSRNGQDAEFPERRSALLGLGALLASSFVLPSDVDAATTKPAKPDYYQELLKSRGAPDTSSLLKKYEKTKAGPSKDGKKPGQTAKPSAPPPTRTTVKPARNSATSSSPGPISAPAPINPLAIALGLVTVGGGVLLGQKGSKKSSTSKAVSGPGTRIVKKPTSTPPKRSGQGTLVARPAPKSSGTLVKKASPPTSVIGTRIKSATDRDSRSGTKVKSAAVGTKKKSVSTTKVSAEKDGGSNIGAVLGLGVTAIALVGLVTAGNPGKKESSAPKPESVATLQKAESKEEKKSVSSSPSPPPPAPAPKIETPKSPEPMPAETPKSELPLAPVTPPKPVPVPVPAPAPSPSSLPSGKAAIPTTASSPVILVGGGVVAILALAALTTNTNSTSSGASASASANASASPGVEQPSEESAEAAAAKQRAAEARAWIEAWRSKQREG